MSKKTILFVSTIVIVSAILSIATVRTTSLKGATQCVAIGTCQGDRANDKGTHIVKEWGFPSTYRTVEEFKPDNAQHYASVSTESQSTNIFLIATNAIFWASFLFAAYIGAIKIKNR